LRTQGDGRKDEKSSRTNDVLSKQKARLSVQEVIGALARCSRA